MFVIVFFFKQKTAYDMRISDWSSDVCSSDLGKANMDQPAIEELVVGRALFVEDREDLAILQPLADGVEFGGEVGSVHGPSYRAPPLAPRRSRIGPGLAMRRRALAGAPHTHVRHPPGPGLLPPPPNPHRHP